MVRESALCRTKGLTEAHRFGKGRGCRTNSLLACIWPSKPGSGRIWVGRRFSPLKRFSAGQITLKRTFLRQNVIWPDKSQRLPSTSDWSRPLPNQRPRCPCAPDLLSGFWGTASGAQLDVAVRTSPLSAHAPGVRCQSTGPGARVTRRRYEPIRRKRLTPGSGGCRRGPCRVGGRVRYERKCRNSLTPGSDGCRRRPCEADGVPAIADKSWGGFWL